MSHGDMTTHEQFRNLYCNRSDRGISCGGGTVCTWIGSLDVVTRRDRMEARPHNP
jgi:hypothetical protein